MRNLEMTEAGWRWLTEAASRNDGQRPPAALHPPAEALHRSARDLYAPLACAAKGFVLAQVGQSLDGRVATPSGDARDISGREGLRHLHRCRALVDAVVVGIGTVLHDDPSLSVREVPGKSPVRVVIDSRGRLPAGAKMLHDQGTPVLQISAPDAPAPPPGVCRITVPREEGVLTPAAILAALAARGLNRVLVEGGGCTIAHFLGAGCIDRLHVAVAPLIIGSGPCGLRLPEITRLSEAHRPRADVYDIGGDILFDCHVADCVAPQAASEPQPAFPAATFPPKPAQHRSAAQGLRRLR